MKMHEEVTTRFEYEPTLEETMTRPIVKPIDWVLIQWSARTLGQDEEVLT
jgi:hypothetical protein